MNAQTLLIVVILIIVLIPAITSTWKHMKGEGDCCGGPKEKPVKKTARKAKVEPEKAEEAPKKRGRKPKAEAEPKAEKAPAKRTRKPKEPKE